jgi:hypothetical protein
MTHNCDKCNKNYASYQSLWIHNKKFHTTTSTQHPLTPLQDPQLPQTDIKFKCTHCSKLFSRKDNLKRHEKTCKPKINNNEKELELEKIKLEKINAETELVKLKLELKNKSTKNINNGTINNNNTVNNITINAMGDEIINKLTTNEIKKLADKGNNALIHIVELLNFNERFPENQYFCNTSLEGDYVTVYDKNTAKINKELKLEFYDKLLSNSYRKVNEVLCNIEFNNKKLQIQDKYTKKLEESVDTTRVFNHRHKKIYKQNINQLSYNKKDMVLGTWSKVKPPTFDDRDDYTDSDSELS